MLESEDADTKHQEQQLQAAIDASNSVTIKSEHEDAPPLEPDTQVQKLLKADEFEHGTVVRTLDGELAGDEFAADALNYQILLGKIDTLLELLKLDA